MISEVGGPKIHQKSFFFDIDFCIDFWSTFWSKNEPKLTQNRSDAVTIFAPKIDPGAQGEFWIHFGRPFAPFWHPLAPFSHPLAPFWFTFGSHWLHFGSLLASLRSLLRVFGLRLAPACSLLPFLLLHFAIFGSERINSSKKLVL